MLIIISIIYFIICYIYFLKKWYEYFAITRVYIPNFIDSRHEFINDIPLNILKKRKKMIIFFYVAILVLTAICFERLTLYIMLASFILSFITCTITFKAIIYENQIFTIFSAYLTKE